MEDTLKQLDFFIGEIRERLLEEFSRVRSDMAAMRCQLDAMPTLPVGRSLELEVHETESSKSPGHVVKTIESEVRFHGLSEMPGSEDDIGATGILSQSPFSPTPSNTSGMRKVRSRRRYQTREDWRKFKVDALSSGRFTATESRRPAVMQRVLTPTQDSKSRSLDSLVVKPGSALHSLKAIAEFIVLIFDIFYFPLGIGFDIFSELSDRVVSWTMCVFWTVDVMGSFFMGRYKSDGRIELRFRKVAKEYAATWLFFDLAILIVDYFFLVDSDAEVSFASPFRLAYTLRFLRMLRSVKFAQRVRELIDDAAKQSPRRVCIALSIGPLLFLGLVVHVSACFWHRVGLSDGGWVERQGLEGKSVGTAYLESLHWIVAQVHGGSSFAPQGEPEHVYATVIELFGMFFTCLFISVLSSALSRDNDPGALALQRAFRQYMKDRHISESFGVRVKQHLRAQADSGVCGRITKEGQMLQALPENLQIELHQLVRLPILHYCDFFVDLSVKCPGPVRSICHEALSPGITLAHETCFQIGDSCVSMRFVESGEMSYVQESELEQENEQNVTKVLPGCCLSEAVLWTKWEHCGSLLALKDSVCLDLKAAAFESIVGNHNGACVQALEYAQRFLWRLNRLPAASDLPMPTDPNEENPAFAHENAHYIFISHFKKEAGTEATLLQEGLSAIIRDDPAHPGGEFPSPVFLDSENLNDLRQLKDHVALSDNLLLLLTPEILSRPWCLVEIAVAVSTNANVVPVVVERPGIHFEYPDEEYFQRLRSGLTLKPDDLLLLSREGILLRDLERSVRHVFLQVALPFSPHKNTNIRQAELINIMNRCSCRSDVPI
eukprot:CAMPEP_0170578070 /NCGR_PEP_ID=MMETSP0224-20130122/5264_1 /TAXON_ID=285029 /ORGANISM="Togula jolla, Strain CCCM 725" /LENGTH=834 /DNA_ID=CAMNT_0010901023 /DNA_START=11 /DNA_END=2515 /DNA_ORIENTATION=+